MPLTIAHPALVIPIRHRLVLSALVIGSMVPDFSKIFSLSREVSLGHSVPEVFWFCVPVGLISFIFFQRILKRPLFLLLPANHQKRLIPWLDPFPLRTVAQWRLVIVSLVIGAFTHLFWDSFTHSHGWFVEAWPLLQNYIHIYHRHSLPIYDCLQVASAAGGLIFLAASYVWFYQKASVHPLPSALPVIPVKVKFMLGGCSIAAAGILATVFANAHPYPRIDWETLIGRAAMAFLAVFCCEVILFGILCHFYLGKISAAKASG